MIFLLTLYLLGTGDDVSIKKETDIGIASVNCVTTSKPVFDKKLQVLHASISKAVLYNGGLSPEERKKFDMEEEEKEKERKILE